jgi:hypothetical protein
VTQDAERFPRADGASPPAVSDHDLIRPIGEDGYGRALSRDDLRDLAALGDRLAARRAILVYLARQTRE